MGVKSECFNGAREIKIVSASGPVRIRRDGNMLCIDLSEAKSVHFIVNYAGRRFYDRYFYHRRHGLTRSFEGEWVRIK